jgi:hypothetical protein
MCAANTSGAAVMAKTPLAHLTPNILMNVSMLDAAYQAGVKKFLFISSNTVYPLADYPVKESDVTNEFYEKYFIVAWMKRFTEIVCEMYATKIANPMKVCVVRPANIYGEFDDFEWETSHVIPALIRKVVERHDPLMVWGNGEDLKTYLEENKKLYALKGYVGTLDKTMKQLNQAAKMINASKTMTADEKREAIDKIHEAQLRLTSRVRILRKDYE